MTMELTEGEGTLLGSSICFTTFSDRVVRVVGRLRFAEAEGDPYSASSAVTRLRFEVLGAGEGECEDASVWRRAAPLADNVRFLGEPTASQFKYI